MAAWKVAPALTAGCACILKPAEETPLSALFLAELCHDAGIPPGLINVVTGLGHEAGALLAAHGSVDKVAFTGSTEVGREIVRAASGNLKKVTLELGGKSPVIVLEDADLPSAISGAAQAIFSNSGQVCTAGSRLYVHHKHYGRVVDGLSEIASSLQMGYGLEAGSVLGPLVSKKQQSRVLSYIRSGIDDGATVQSGGRSRSRGYFVEPTVLVDVQPEMSVVREEIFGPVVAAMAYDSLDEVAASANDTTYGLSASVWTKDIRKANWLARKLRVGRVGINVHGVADVTMPTGGYKQSGWGRELGPEGLDSFLEYKSVFVAP
jgi:phenylacetaldehyde dehydrogenase